MTRFHELVEPLNLQSISVVLPGGSNSTLTGSTAFVYIPWDCDLVRVAAVADSDPGEALSIVVNDNSGATCANITFASGITGGIADAKTVVEPDISNAGFAEGDYIEIDGSDNNTNAQCDVTVSLIFDVGHDG